MAEKFLSHLKNGNSSRIRSAPVRRSSYYGSPRYDNCVDIDAVYTKKPSLKTKRSLTYGSYYPDNGYGNNAGVFNIVRAPRHQRPQTSVPCENPKKVVVREKTAPAHATRRRSEQVSFYPNPINRSSIFGAVCLPPGQHWQYSQPRIENPITGEVMYESVVPERVHTASPREVVVTDRRHSGSPREAVNGTHHSGSPRTRSPKNPDSARLKFSANMHIGVDEDPVCDKENIPIQIQEQIPVQKCSHNNEMPMKQVMCDKGNTIWFRDSQSAPPKSTYEYAYSFPSDGYRDIGLQKKYPGRPYQFTQFLLG